ncbi:MAG: hypothetical protein IPG47_12240 [Thermoflexaceae bacterium]|nr:hypothetical protein [Thermoflexaceae bacterium]
MVFSSTSPISPSIDEAGAGALFAAWEAMRRARELPWNADDADSWLAAFHREVTGARALLLAHVAVAESPSSPLLDRPSEPGAVSRQLDEHEQLVASIDQILAAASAGTGGTIDRVVDVTERAILLEIRMAMHLNRLHGLLGPRAAVSAAGVAR